MDEDMQEPKPMRSVYPMADLSFATLGWINRSARAIGANRFFECLERAQFYLERTIATAQTPAERAIVYGLAEMMARIIDADREAREMLKESCSGMDAADATEFVEMCEAAEISD